jgi:DNA-binding transcriptional MocR family regulator
MITYALSPTQAGALAARGRLLLRRRQITVHQAALLDAMLWTARRPGSGVLTASFKVLARLAGQGRSTVAAGIAALEKLGFIKRIKRRARVFWGASVASRQIANAYVLRADDTESSNQTANRKQKNSTYLVEIPFPAQQSAQAALAARRKALEQEWRDRPAKSFATPVTPPKGRLKA